MADFRHLNYLSCENRNYFAPDRQFKQRISAGVKLRTIAFLYYLI